MECAGLEMEVGSFEPERCYKSVFAIGGEKSGRPMFSRARISTGALRGGHSPGRSTYSVNPDYTTLYMLHKKWYRSLSMLVIC